MRVYLFLAMFLLISLLMGETAIAERTEKEEDGKKITRIVSVNTFAGGRSGNIHIKDKTILLTDEAAKEMSEATAKEDALKSGFLCAIVTYPIGNMSLIAAVLSGTSCAVLSADNKPELRKGDYIIEESIGHVAGGVGGSMNTYRVAIGKRDGQDNVLYFYTNTHDKEKSREWLEALKLNYSSWPDSQTPISPPANPNLSISEP
ncbi:MAG: hypothetical protein JRE64_21685 [Deltaproteobacteria bacterium]|nr:hypothetical protein [Deltaproteobacteria bacterium]